MPIRRSFVCLLLFCSLIVPSITLGFVPSAAASESASSGQSLSRVSREWRLTLDSVETYIRYERKQAKQQQTYGQALQDIVGQAAQIREDTEREIAAQQRLLDALGAPPAVGQPPEQPDIAKQRSDLNQTIATYRARLSQIDLTVARAKTLQEELSQAYREDFLSRILEKRPVTFSLPIFRDSLVEMVSLLGVMIEAPVSWYQATTPEQRQDLWFGWRSLLIVAAAVAAWPVRRWLLRRFGPDPAAEQPLYARRFLAAIAVAVGNGLMPSVLLAAIYLRIRSDLLPTAGLAAEVITQSSLALLFFIVAAALAKAALAPDHPSWRLTRLTARSATHLYWTIVVLAAVYAIDQAVTRVGATMDVSEDVAVTWLRLVGGIEALGLIMLMRASVWQTDERSGAEDDAGRPRLR